MVPQRYLAIAEKRASVYDEILSALFGEDFLNTPVLFDGDLSDPAIAFRHPETGFLMIAMVSELPDTITVADLPDIGIAA